MMFIIDWIFDRLGYIQKETLNVSKPCKKVATKRKSPAKKSQSNRRLG